MQTLKLILYITLIAVSTNSANACTYDENEESKPYQHETFFDITLEKARVFIVEVRDAINRDDRLKVAELVNCTTEIPCTWYKKLKFSSRRKMVETTSEKDFLKHYDEIINQNIKDLFNHKYAIQSMSIDPMYGFTICSGYIWFWSHDRILTMHIFRNCDNLDLACKPHG